MKYKSLFLFFMVFLTCCSEDDISPQQGDVTIEERAIVLGKKLPNPYSLNVMQKAVDELSAESTLKAAQQLQATHYYLRFAPRDTAEIDLLEADTTIFFYTYPMDYEIVQEGDTYTDPDLPSDVLKYMYCAVSVNHQLPNVSYEVLDELYILEETNVVVESTDEDDIEDGNKSAQTSYWEILEQKAKEIVGAEISYNKSKWRPQGDVYYHDTSIDKDIPLEGVPVRCRKSIFVTHQCCTNANGHFSFDRLRGQVDYYIRWRRDNFKIREHSGLNVAETNLKSNTKSSVTYTVTYGTRAWECASIFRAAHFYYYKAAAYGMSRPSKESLTIRPSNANENKLGCYGRHIIMSDVHIYELNRPSSSIFCTTIHEIAHSVHNFWNTNKYKHCSSIVKESWSRGASWYLTSKIYKKNEFVLSYDHKEYTGIIQDLMDGKDSYRDKVSGISIQQIEKAIKNCTDWDGFCENIISINSNNNKNDIKDLFNYWSGN